MLWHESEDMKNSLHQSFSELEVNDFGPVVKAKIDLRPLTVFVGPSNTGKSYLAILLYSLHRFFALDPHIVVFAALSAARKLKLNKETQNDLVEWAERIFVLETDPLNAENLIAPRGVADLVRSAFDGFNKLGDSLGRDLDMCFELGGEIGNLVRRGRDISAARVVFRKSLPDASGEFSHTLTLNSRETKLGVGLPRNIPVRLDSRSIEELRNVMKFPMSPSAGLDEKELWTLIRGLVVAQMSQVFGSLALPAFYLPADRGGVMSTHKAFIQGLIESSSMVRHPAPAVSGVIADFLRQLFSIELDGLSNRRHTSRDNLVKQIENRVLGGAVRIHKSPTGLPVFKYRPEGWKADLPLTNASSMVSELAPVVLYLRHIVLPENVLIVEEPESHLHPAMQVEFTRQLAAVVNSGIRVIITTHSEWLLEELANLVRLSKLSKAARKKIDKDDVALSPDQVGVWLFEPKNKPKGSVVKEIPLDEESGLFPSGFSDVAVALHNKWADISSGIGEKR